MISLVTIDRSGFLTGASQQSIEYKIIESFRIIFSKIWKSEREMFQSYMCLNGKVDLNVANKLPN